MSDNPAHKVYYSLEINLPFEHFGSWLPTLGNLFALFPKARNVFDAYHLLWLALPFLTVVSPPLIFRESNRFFIRELAGSSFLFLRLFTPAPEVTEGRRRAANPHAATESAVCLELRFRTSPCWRSHALSRQSPTKRSSCVALTFLLMFRVISNGFWMYKADVSGLISSFPCRKGIKWDI